jgi:integrase
MRRKGTTWVFPAPKGGMWHRSEFAVKFKLWAWEAGLDITFHDLRHTFASLMVESGVHPKVLHELMGHKTFGVTMDLYTHLHDQQKRSAMDELQKLIEHVG